nr:hypothetical protein [Tanacetum cinerariifolium]
MELCTKLSDRVLNLETTKTAQAKEISSLKRRVKRLEKKKRSGTHKLKRLYKVGLSTGVESFAKEQSLGEEDVSKQGRNIADIDADAEITLVNETREDQRRFDDQEMFDTRVLYDEEVVVEKAVAVKEVNVAQDQVSAATTTIVKDLTVDDITLAKALEALKTSKPKIRGIVVRDHKELSESITIPTLIADSTRPKAKGVVMEEPSEATTTTIPIPSKVQDIGKGSMVEEPLKMKKKDQISFDEQEVRRLQAKLDQEQRLEQRFAEEEAQKALEDNIVVIEQWHDVQAKIEADFELAQRIQAEEQEQLTIDKKSKIVYGVLRENKKNMEGWKPRALKNKSFAKIKELFDKAMTRINNFVDFRTELVEESSKKAEESSSKRARDELEQENAKKQKVDDDQEAAKLKRIESLHEVTAVDPQD